MIVAGVEKTYETPDGIVLTDQRWVTVKRPCCPAASLLTLSFGREWVFLPELEPRGRTTKVSRGGESPTAIRRYQTQSPVIASSHHNQTAVSLFRFSALTFNGTWGECPGTKTCADSSPLLYSSPDPLLSSLGAERRGSSRHRGPCSSKPRPHARAVPVKQGGRPAPFIDDLSSSQPHLRSRRVQHQAGRVGRGVVPEGRLGTSVYRGQTRVVRVIRRHGVSNADVPGEAEAPSGAWMIVLLDTGSQRCRVEVPSTQSC